MRNLFTRKTNKGFTLIELLIVVGIVSMLNSMVITSVQAARSKSRDSVRIQNIVTLRTALELYKSENGGYPKTFDPITPLPEPIPKTVECDGNTEDVRDYIAGLAPKYIAELPTDPNLDCGGVTHSWSYASDGVDYKIITHGENTLNSLYHSFADPAWDGGGDPCIIDYNDAYHFGAWTDGAACWSI